MTGKLLNIFVCLVKDFLKCLEVLNDFYEFVEALELLPRLLNIFQRSWSAWMS